MSIHMTKVTDSIAVVLARDEIHNYNDGSDDDQFLIVSCGNDFISNSSLANLITELIKLKTPTRIGKAEKVVELIDRFLVSNLHSGH